MLPDVPGAHLDGVAPGLGRRPVDRIQRVVLPQDGPDRSCVVLHPELVLVIPRRAGRCRLELDGPDRAQDSGALYPVRDGQAHRR